MNKLKDLKVRVCHGNTLTTAVILHELAEDVKEVFLTGSTSKIGKAIALYLCRKHVRVLVIFITHFAKQIYFTSMFVLFNLKSCIEEGV